MTAFLPTPVLEPKPGVLPDGRPAMVTGDPERWSQSPADGPPSIACVQWIFREVRGATPPALPVSLSLVSLRDAFQGAGLVEHFDPVVAPVADGD